MRKFGALLLFLSLTLVANADSDVQLRADRESAIYRVGETIKFNVLGTPGEGATYSVVDGVIKTSPVKLDSKIIEVKADRPGFVLVIVNTGSVNQEGKEIIRKGGAAVEPEKIQPGVKKPIDFDSFWDGEVAKLRESPLEVVRETPVPDEYLKDYGYKAYDIEARRGDIAITGFLFVPENAEEKSLPGVLSFNGASSVTAKFDEAANLALNGRRLVLNTNFHALPNMVIRDKAKEAEMRKMTDGYRYADCADREKYYMRKIFLRTVVAADYLAQRKEYDGVNMASFGGSLGGCQSLVCAALVPEIKYCVSNATAMCDHWGEKACHLAGWPNLVEKHPESKAVAPYFDVVNFATRIKCPIQMSVGFIDNTVSPASTYAAYNTISGVEKQMKHSVTAGHGAAWDGKEKNVFDYGREEIIKVLSNK